jgi:hypothetical protein
MEAIADFDNADDPGRAVFGDKHLVVRVDSLDEVLELEVPVKLLVPFDGVSGSHVRVKDLPYQIEDLLFFSGSDPGNCGSHGRNSQSVS